MPKLKSRAPTKKSPAKPPAKGLDYQQIAQELLDKTQIPGTVSFSQEEDLLKFQIDTDQPGILIGFHGETLAALERILGLMLEKRTGAWHRLTVNVGDYRQRREETLNSLAISTAQRVKFSGQPWPLPSLSAADRRIIHLILADHPDVTTESEGEGPTRHIIVKPRSK